jgi:hypothetical protein
MAWPPETVKAQGIPPAVLPSISYCLFRHSHGGTGCGSTHKPFFASCSRPSGTVSEMRDPINVRSQHYTYEQSGDGNADIPYGPLG